jgi:hypothetical protein
MIGSMLPRIPSLLIVLFAASPLLAQADLAVIVSAPAAVRPGESFTAQGTVTNIGSAPAENVRVSLGTSHVTPCVDQQAIGTLLPGQSRVFSCTETAHLPSPGVYFIEVWMQAESDQPDYGPGSNYDNRYIEVLTAPDLRVWADVPPPAVPADRTQITFHYQNIARVAAEDTVITITSSAAVIAVPDFCSITGTGAVCHLGTLNPGDAQGPSHGVFSLELRMPDASEARESVTMVITSSVPDIRPENDRFEVAAATYRTFFVTDTNDVGEGSLRQAIETANASCVAEVSCLIAFRIPPTGNAWHTLAPASPLPIVRAKRIRIDGSTQALYFGDTNPAGPEIELTGRTAGDTSGLVVERRCAAEIRGLAVNGFAQYGLEVASPIACDSFVSTSMIARNFVGTDPTGQRAVPNHRGLQLRGGNWTVADNLISGNVRSGVWADAGVNSIRNNTIGLDRTLTGNLGNGASGVYIAAAAGGTDVDHNYIGFNHDFGIAIDALAANVAIHGNSIQANRQGGIDWGLDGPGGQVPFPAPVITSVAVGSDGFTVIEGTTGEIGGTFNPVVAVYANDAPDPSGFGEGQYTLGTVEARQGRFTFVTPLDLKGKWVAATSTRHVYNGWLRNPPVRAEGDTGWGYYTTTSEFGRAVEVR